jgi:ABC-type taurine transport system ATPase subunit
MTDKVALAQADLAKRWADNAGLQPFSFSLWSNELVVVRGRSGSGKSTLLALLAGWTAGRRSTCSTGPWARLVSSAAGRHRDPAPGDRSDHGTDDGREC